MGIRVLSGVLFREVLAYLLPLCNEDTGPVTPALIFRGVTECAIENWFEQFPQSDYIFRVGVDYLKVPRS
ncbi:hypothetical protein HanPI659440_Chr12g0466901 [Helianthus annuus]|nr:hypothetical protein HanPI659440_Chr12g0466901 [Helianthus annuus]